MQAIRLFFILFYHMIWYHIIYHFTIWPSVLVAQRQLKRGIRCSDDPVFCKTNSQIKMFHWTKSPFVFSLMHSLSGVLNNLITGDLPLPCWRCHIGVTMSRFVTPVNTWIGDFQNNRPLEQLPFVFRITGCQTMGPFVTTGWTVNGLVPAYISDLHLHPKINP